MFELSRKKTLLLTGILLLAAGLRVYGLGDESLWLDEGYTAHRATDSFLHLVAEFRHETQTALYYVGERIWCAAFGTSEFALRFPSAVLGVAATWGVFLLAREIFSLTTGLWAALLLAINPFAIFYSQEARPYCLFLAASIFSLYFLLRMMRRPDKLVVPAYLLATSIAMYTHPLAPLLLMVHGAVWLIYRRDPEYPAAAQQPWEVIGAMAIAGVVYLPQLLFMWGTIVSKTQGTSRASWIPMPDGYAFQHTEQQYFMNPALATLALLILGGGLLLLARANAKARRGMLLLLAIVMGCIGAPWLISQIVTPVYVDRYTIPALAALIIALAWVFSELPRLPRVLLLAVFLGLNMFTLGRYYSRLDKEPWRETAQFVAQTARTGDLIILSASFTREVFSYYFQAPKGTQVVAPWNKNDIPFTVDTANRIILVQAYNNSRHPATADLLARIAEDRTATPPALIDGRWPRNPWAYWAPDIRVTVYERTSGLAPHASTLISTD